MVTFLHGGRKAYSRESRRMDDGRGQKAHRQRKRVARAVKTSEVAGRAIHYRVHNFVGGANEAHAVRLHV